MKYRVLNDYSFSILHSNVYISDDSILSSAELRKCGWKDERANVFYPEKNTEIREEYFAKRVRYLGDEEDFKNRSDDLIRKHYSNLILNPPVNTKILWPKDIVELSTDILENNSLLIANNYRAFADDVTRDVSHFALLFNKNSFSLFENIQYSLKNYINKMRQDYGYSSVNYQNKSIRKIAYSIVKEIKSLNNEGYLYNDIDLSRFFVLKDLEIALDFTNLVYSFDEVELLKKGIACIEEPEEYPLSYSDPARFQNKITVMDEMSQNYSLTALLFELFFGRAPYEGEKYDYLQGTTTLSHVNKYQQILASPIFIFDNKDFSNELGEGSEYDLCKQLWNDCNDEIKGMFYRTLVEENATRSRADSELYCPTLEDWLTIFEKVNWDKE